MSGRPWTRTEIARLKVMRLRGLGSDVIAAALGRSHYATEFKIHRLIAAGEINPYKRGQKAGVKRGPLSAEQSRALNECYLAHVARSAGIRPDQLDDYRMLRRKGFPRPEASEMVRRWDVEAAQTHDARVRRGQTEVFIAAGEGWR